MLLIMLFGPLMFFSSQQHCSATAIYPTQRAIRAPPIKYTPGTFRPPSVSPQTSTGVASQLATPPAAIAPAHTHTHEHTPGQPQMQLVATYQIPTPSAPSMDPPAASPALPPQLAKPASPALPPAHAYATADNVTLPRLPSQPADATPATTTSPAIPPQTLAAAVPKQTVPVSPVVAAVKPTPPATASPSLTPATAAPATAAPVRDPSLFSAKRMFESPKRTFTNTCHSR